MTQTYTDIDLSFDELVRACGGGADWVVQLIEEEVISINGSPAQARYSSLHLARIRRAGRIHRDFDASAAATALILQLLDELETLRRQHPTALKQD
ncbi:chaperone modulator CbpM [Paralysiella testudinis]|jgi:chaperone modulatory protein CbpM|uniref:MerR family transcriptional regulator n=1 Tax=Paralysiella testudinis TaxID=2809020 RepID=A0A892ZHI3_9NEIS|nr:chaperone modulator CbpM [Paralysiella testudinis]QRQ81287.1 MerR family transcriptional regulator [Paralysiella testudinis]